jgi:hypothetical protein
VAGVVLMLAASNAEMMAALIAVVVMVSFVLGLNFVSSYTMIIIIVSTICKHQYNYFMKIIIILLDIGLLDIADNRMACRVDLR